MKKYLLASLFCCNLVSATYYSINQSQEFSANNPKHIFYNLLNTCQFLEAVDYIDLLEEQEQHNAQDAFLWTVRYYKTKLGAKYIDVLAKFMNTYTERICDLTETEKKLVIEAKTNEIKKANKVIKKLAGLKAVKTKQARSNFSIRTPQVNIAFDVKTGLRTNIIIDSSDEEEQTKVEISARKRIREVDLEIDSLAPEAKRPKK